MIETYKDSLIHFYSHSDFLLVHLNINIRLFGPWLLSKLWESHCALFVTLSVPQQAEDGRHHENIVWHVSILLSDWINHSSHNICP